MHTAPLADAALPRVAVDVAGTTRTEFDPNRFTDRVVGHAHAIRWQPLEQAATEAGQNVDQLLCQFALEWTHKSPPKRPCMVWWTTAGQGITMTVTTARGGLRGGALDRIPGHFESGRGHLSRAALPYLYWSGSEWTRLHGLANAPAPGTHLLLDIGCGFLAVSETSKAMWSQHHEAPGEAPDYAALPLDGVTHLTVSGKPAEMRHGWYLRR